MIVQFFLILLIYAVFVFALVLIEHLAVRSADSLAEWMTLRRLAMTGAIAAVIVGSGIGVAFKLGWIQFGTPYDSPGFEDQLPETSQPVTPAGKAPVIKTTVSKESMDRANEAHQKKVKAFETTP